MLAVADDPRPRFIAQRCYWRGPKSWAFGIAWGLRPVQQFGERRYRHAVLIHLDLPLFVSFGGAALRVERY